MTTGMASVEERSVRFEVTASAIRHDLALLMPGEPIKQHLLHPVP